MVSTLTSERLVKLLASLHVDAERTDRFAVSSAYDELKLRGSAFATDYKRAFSAAQGAYLAIKPDFGRLLYVLVRSRAATNIIEFGTSFGISTIYLAAALQDNGGGRLITTELQGNKVERAKENLATAGLDHLVEFRAGDALETLTGGVEQVQFVFLDGAKNLYVSILKLLEPHLESGATIAADNAQVAESMGRYLTYVRDPRNGYVSVGLPFDASHEISVRS